MPMKHQLRRAAELVVWVGPFTVLLLLVVAVWIARKLAPGEWVGLEDDETPLAAHFQLIAPRWILRVLGMEVETITGTSC